MPFEIQFVSACLVNKMDQFITMIQSGNKNAGNYFQVVNVTRIAVKFEFALQMNEGKPYIMWMNNKFADVSMALVIMAASKN